MLVMKLSEKIELIIFLLEQSRSDFDWYDRQTVLEENKQNNLTHEIEGVNTPDCKPPPYKKRASLATELQKCLLVRRAAKNEREINRPIMEFVESDIGKSALNALRKRLGDVRKIENNMSVRRYYARTTENAESLNADAKKNLEELIKAWKQKR